MKFISMLLYLTNVSAVTVEVFHPCENSSSIYREMSTSSTTVGEASITALKLQSVLFIGNVAGINAIFGTPIGMDAMEVVSDREYRAYGWCYQVNGVSPEVMPDQLRVSGEDKIQWWFGHATNLSGEWIEQCTRFDPELSQYQSFAQKLCPELQAKP